MTASPCHGVDIDAAAKLNLGLEVIGRREDGFHEIATIFLAIDLVDHLHLSPASDLHLRCTCPELVTADNLVLRALQALRDETGYDGGAFADLEKHIPAAAGLGGASSDAAAALLAARQLWGLDVPVQSLHTLAARLGSDVPFFLHGGCALGRGRGEKLQPLPLPENVSFVVVVPEITIPNKTATLYARLGADDNSDGQRIAAQAAHISLQRRPDPGLLGNAFARPLYALEPRLAELPGIMREAGADAVAISGAGPAHYAPLMDNELAEHIANRLRERLTNRARIFVARPIAGSIASSRPL